MIKEEIKTMKPVMEGSGYNVNSHDELVEKFSSEMKKYMENDPDELELNITVEVESNGPGEKPFISIMFN